MFTLPTAATIKVNKKTASTPLYVFMTIGYLVRYPFLPKYIKFLNFCSFARQKDGYNVLESVFLHVAFVSSSIHLRAALQRESIHTHTHTHTIILRLTEICDGNQMFVFACIFF